jgi:hypothetical protein
MSPTTGFAFERARLYYFAETCQYLLSHVFGICGLSFFLTLFFVICPTQDFQRGELEKCRAIQTCQKIKTAERKALKRARAADAVRKQTTMYPSSVTVAGRTISNTAFNQGDIAKKRHKKKLAAMDMAQTLVRQELGQEHEQQQQQASQRLTTTEAQQKQYEVAATTFRIASLKQEQERFAVARAAQATTEDTLWRFSPPTSAAAMQAANARVASSLFPSAGGSGGADGEVAAAARLAAAGGDLALQRQLLLHQQQEALLRQQRDALIGSSSSSGAPSCLSWQQQQQQLQHLQLSQRQAFDDAAAAENQDMQVRLFRATLGRQRQAPQGRSRLGSFFRESGLGDYVSARNLNTSTLATSPRGHASSKSHEIMRPPAMSLQADHDSLFNPPSSGRLPSESHMAPLYSPNEQRAKESLYQSLATNMQRRLDMAANMNTMSNFQQAQQQAQAQAQLQHSSDFQQAQAHAQFQHSTAGLDLAAAQAQSRARAAAMAEVASRLMRNQAVDGTGLGASASRRATPSPYFGDAGSHALNAALRHSHEIASDRGEVVPMMRVNAHQSAGSSAFKPADTARGRVSGSRTSHRRTPSGDGDEPSPDSTSYQRSRLDGP